MKQNRLKLIAAAIAISLISTGCALDSHNELTSNIEITETIENTTTTGAVEVEPVEAESSTSADENEPEIQDTPQPAETTAATTTVATIATTTPVTTTTKPVETTATSDTDIIVPEQNAKPVPDVANINARTILKYEYGVKNFKLSGKNYVMYDFSNKKDIGVGRDSTINPARMCYGITAEVKDNKIYFATYNDYPDIYKISVTAMDVMSDTKITSLKVSSKTQMLDCSDFENGMYALRASFSNNKKPSLIFYVNKGNVYLCSCAKMTVSELKRFQNRRTLVQNMLDEYGITPENSVSTENLCYPWNDRANHNSDTPKWRAMSYEITKSDWSDGRKLFAFHEWMCENLAYDFYKANVLGVPRATYYQTFDGTYDTYQTRIGVCFDFTNILATMCREQNIPCITIDTKTHTWNIVYINNVWVEIDMTCDIENAVYGKDMTKWNKPSSPYCYDGFYNEIVNAENPTSINDGLWDYDVLYGRREYKGAA